MVFASAGSRVWVTTSRSSAKARAWRGDPRVAGMVRAGEEAVAFVGRATMYDLLDAGTWSRSIVESPLLALAAVRFTRKNARFFGGYAVDAHRLPLAWTPPGRVFAELRIERSALLRDGRVANASGDWGDEVRGIERFRASRAGADPFASLPPDVRDGLERSGRGALALEVERGPVVLPCSWLIDGAAAYAALDAEALALAQTPGTVPAALGVDRPSSWRARAMVGAMIRGAGEVVVGSQLGSGHASFERIARSAGIDPSHGALVRIRPRSLVWWRGWESGTEHPG